MLDSVAKIRQIEVIGKAESHVALINYTWMPLMISNKVGAESTLNIFQWYIEFLPAHGNDLLIVHRRW